MEVDTKYIAFEEGFVGRPYVPPGEHSGVTIDYGLDLGQQTIQSFHFYLDGILTGRDLAELTSCVGKRGDAARALVGRLGVRWDKGQAVKVLERLVPAYFEIARQSYPRLELLPAPVQTALTSLTVNRGGVPTLIKGVPIEVLAGSTDEKGRYEEELAIRRATRDGDVPLVEKMLRLMGRDTENPLWPGEKAPNPALRRRRIREADMVAKWLASRGVAA